MTSLRDLMSAFGSAHVESFAGLPADVRLADLEDILAFDRSDVRHGDAGDPVRTRAWVPAESTTYRGGLRLWLDDDGDRVVLVEGVHPVDSRGEPLPAPDLGAPGAVFDAVLGPLRVTDAEHAYAARGLAVRVFADTGVLVGVLGFAPTTDEDYRRRLQPHPEPTRPFPQSVEP